MKSKILQSSLVWGTLLGMILVGTIGPTVPQLQAAGNNNKVDVFVSFDRAPGAAEEALVRAFGGTVKYNYDIVPAIAASVPEAAIIGLLHNPHVTAVELDGQVRAVDTELDNAWGVKRIGSGAVHDGGNKGTGVKIGIIDSGVDYTHPDLNDVYIGGYDFVEGEKDAMDVYGHGTHVAGTACAEDNGLGVVGVASECALYSLRVLNNDGVGSWSNTVAAMDWAVANGMQVVNLSLGSSVNPGGTVKAAFDNAEAAGVVIVAAAGNSGNPAGRGNNTIYPARYASVIAVAATDSNDQRASWSSTGDEVELAAPGVSVLSTWNDATSPHDPQPICVDNVCYYKYGSGTSMASPHVAGAAALVISAGITDTNADGKINDEVRSILDSTTEDLGAVGRDVQYGFGLVNVAAAVAAVAPPSPVVNVNLSTDKTDYVSGTDTTAVLTAVITDEYGSAITGLSSSAFITTIDVTSTSVIFTETATAGSYTGNLVISGLAIGVHTAKVTVTDTRLISGSGSANFNINSAPTPGTTVSISSITYSTQGGKNQDKHLDITVALVDKSNNPVASASVSIDLSRDSVLAYSGTGTTGSDGKTIFKYNNAPSGYYSTEVTDVIASGYTWDGVTPSNGFNK